jgi:hypothetical protein
VAAASIRRLVREGGLPVPLLFIALGLLFLPSTSEKTI